MGVPGFDSLLEGSPIFNPDGTAFSAYFNQMLTAIGSRQVETLEDDDGAEIGDLGKVKSLAGYTLTLDLAASLEAGWFLYVKGPGSLLPSGADTIEGDTSFAIEEGTSALVIGDGVSGFVVLQGGGGGGGSGAVEIEPAGEWDGGTTYAKNDVVSYEDESWLSRVDDNLNNQPDTSPMQWQKLAGKGAPGADGEDGSDGSDGSDGEPGAAGAKIFVQNEEPSTANPVGSIWIDADSANLDLYVLAGAPLDWGDTGRDLKGIDGEGAVDSVNGQTGAVVIAAGDIGFTPGGALEADNVQTAIEELDAEKIATSALDTDGTLAANSDTKIASQKAVKTYVDALLAAQDAMVFKGVVDCSANPNYPAADRGHSYRVSVAGKIGGGSGPNVETGDLLLCITDSTSSGSHASVGANWGIIQTNIDGGVIGPSAVTDANPAVFDGTSGKLIKQLTYADFKTNLVLTKGDVGLGSVTNDAQLKAASNLSDVANAATAFGAIKQAASTAATGVVQLADAAAMEAATAGRVVTADVQHRHPSAAKAWARINVSGGTPSVAASFNVSGIVDNGVGNLTIQIDTDFSSANWAAYIGALDASAIPIVYANAIAAGSITATAFNVLATALFDPASWHFFGYGDQ